MEQVIGLDTAAVSQRTGISPRRLGHWDRMGIVSPSLSPARGSGSRRLYAADDLAYVLLVKAIRQLGGALELARSVASGVRIVQNERGSLAGVRLAAGADAVLYCGSDQDAYLKSIEDAGAVIAVELDVFVREAVRLCARPSQPSIVIVEAAGMAHQFVIVPGVDSFGASCNGYPNLSGSGETAEAAVDSLRKAIEAISRDEGPPAGRTDSTSETSEGGASTWGGGW